LAVVLTVLSVSMAAPIAASEDDHERARRLRESGEVLPLADVIDKIREQQPGKVLEVEMDRDHDRWVYEIMLLAPNGAVWEYEVDAATGELLEREREY